MTENAKHRVAAISPDTQVPHTEVTVVGAPPEALGIASAVGVTGTASTEASDVTEATEAAAAALESRRVQLAMAFAVSDRELLQGCGDDPDLFAEFYRRHSAAMLTFFMRRTGCAQTAADLSSETFAAALVSRNRFKEQTSTARPWLFGIGHNLLGKYFRRERVSRKYQRRLAARPVELSDSDLVRVEELADLEALRPRIADALDTLPAKQALAVRLRVLQQRDYEHVAAQLGISEGAARVRVSRGLTRLAQLLEDER